MEIGPQTELMCTTRYDLFISGHGYLIVNNTKVGIVRSDIESESSIGIQRLEIQPNCVVGIRCGKNGVFRVGEYKITVFSNGVVDIESKWTGKEVRKLTYDWFTNYLCIGEFEINIYNQQGTVLRLISVK